MTPSWRRVTPFTWFWNRCPDLNDIPQKQNTESFLRLQRAKVQVYWTARWFQIAQIGLTVVFPVVATVGVASFYPNLKSVTAALSLLIAVVDTWWLDRAQRQLLKVAAKISERYDCDLLQLKWNSFAAGKPVDAEVVADYARRNNSTKGLHDWYPPVAGIAPLWIGRIVCQRANLFYDSALRRHWATILLWVTSVVVVGIFAAAWTEHFTLDLLVTTLAAPATPVLIWMIRESFRQRDAAEANETIKGEAEALIAQLKNATADEDFCTIRSREFQDGIYARRAANPMVIPLLYRLRRARMENQMNEGAKELLDQLGYST